MATDVKTVSLNGLIIVISSSETFQKNNQLLIQRLVKEKKSGIYVTLSVAHSVIVNRLEKGKSKANSLFFIDGAGKKCTDGLKEGHYKSVQGPEALTELSIAISEVANTGNYQFLFLDSIGTLQLYNDFENASKFTRFMTNKLKLMGITCVIISLDESQSEKLNSVLKQSAEFVVIE